MRETRAYVASVVTDARVEEILAEGEASGAIKSLRAVRDYMCHRDRREYWNAGRMAPAGNLEFNMRLHDEFSRVLLAAMRAAVAPA